MTSALQALALLVGLAAPVLSAAQQAEMPAPAGFKVGDTWEWSQVDNRTKLQEAKLTRAVVNIDGVLQFSNGATNSQVAAVLVDGTNKPSSKPWRVWPLGVGKKWNVNVDWIRPDGVTGNTKQDAEVAAYEEVVVPAGKFMAFKIVHRGWYLNAQGFQGRQNDTYWYAPDAKADVKHLRDDGFNAYTRELVTYKPGAP